MIENWGEYLSYDDDTFNMGNLERSKVMIWTNCQMEVNYIQNLWVGDKIYEIIIKEIDSTEVICYDENPLTRFHFKLRDDEMKWDEEVIIESSVGDDIGDDTKKVVGVDAEIDAGMCQRGQRVLNEALTEVDKYVGTIKAEISND